MDEFQDKKENIWTSDWKMFTTSKEEIHAMLDNKWEFEIEPDKIIIYNYPFKPSLAFKNAVVFSTEIKNIDVNAYPPTIRVGNELIFISKKHKDKLILFSNFNQLPIVERNDIWSWILEPFLDTEYSDETDKMLTEKLLKYGLVESEVFKIRQEIKVQMLKYNFDTILWEWVYLGALDVLFAMRSKYNTEQFTDFYTRVMNIALRADK